MKSTHMILVGALVVAMTSLQGWDDRSSQVASNKSFNDCDNEKVSSTASREIASFDEFSNSERLGLLFLPRMTAIRKVNEMSEQREQQTEEIRELREQLEQQIEQNPEDRAEVTALQGEIDELNQQLDELSRETAEAYIELQEQKEELAQERDALRAELEAHGVNEDEVTDSLAHVDSEFEKAEEQLIQMQEELEKAREEKDNQQQLITQLEIQACQQGEKISELERLVQEQIEDKEKALERVAALTQDQENKENNEAKAEDEKDEAKEDDINIEALVEAFQGMIQSQINFQNQYAAIDQLQSQPFNMGLDYSGFMMPGLMGQQQQMMQSMISPTGHYWMGHPQMQHQPMGQLQGGLSFLNRPLLDDPSLNSYYSIPTPTPHPGVQQHIPGQEQIRQTIPQARYHLFNNLERNPATNQQQTNFFGGQAAPPQMNSQRPIQDVETFYAGPSRQQ